ncbi:hypothetical protein [Szabonella alba]|uniref:Uncharacterized protein n=1 Tax=Szabonella alba TaxID=2804194 RepID=A0A8K0XZL6_9RHOB|nr:hypothetical protein [Szabonella alba]MBL4917250.1 hypothetical protein [Szabonella alba]
MTKVKEAVAFTLMRTILPPVLGGLGALVATSYPAFYRAICSAPLLPAGVY